MCRMACFEVQLGRESDRSQVGTTWAVAEIGTGTYKATPRKGRSGYSLERWMWVEGARPGDRRTLGVQFVGWWDQLEATGCGRRPLAM